VTEAMQPVRYREGPALFSARQDALNEVLVLLGLRVNEEGKIARGARADNLAEAAKHANSLRAELRRRGVHAEVLRYCSQEVLERNPFHAALEATKSVPDRLRSISGENGDGARLVDATLALGQAGTPRVAINALSTNSERDEQSGFATLCKGLLSMLRNPIAHDPRLSRSVADDDLLELLNGRVHDPSPPRQRDCSAVDRVDERTTERARQAQPLDPSSMPQPVAAASIAHSRCGSRRRTPDQSGSAPAALSPVRSRIGVDDVGAKVPRRSARTTKHSTNALRAAAMSTGASSFPACTSSLLDS